MVWMVRTNQPFSVVEDPVLRNVLESYSARLSGGTMKQPFPRRDFFREHLTKLHGHYNSLKIEMLGEIDSRIALTTDIWSSSNSKSFIGFTAHWITSEFLMKRILLAFVPFPDRHTSENILKKYLDVVDEYKIREKVKLLFEFLLTLKGLNNHS